MYVKQMATLHTASGSHYGSRQLLTLSDKMFFYSSVGNERTTGKIWICKSAGIRVGKGW